jgi:hypothetical protein
MRRIAGLVMAAAITTAVSGCLAEFRPPSRTIVIDGSSPAAAIPVPGVDDEYRWLAANRPGWTPVRQLLVSGPRGKTYDLVTIARGGQSEDIHFDISSFFGKPS